MREIDTSKWAELYRQGVGNRKGEKSGAWKGGISPYPNCCLLRKNRLRKIVQLGGICEICGKAGAKEIHHKDGSRDNHNIENLMLCHPKCHPGKGRRKKTEMQKSNRI